MARRFVCPYLGVEVELTDEREDHIRYRHIEALADNCHYLSQTLAAPDLVRRRDPNLRMFSRWYDELQRGKHTVVVVVDDSAADGRQWIVTAYLTKHWDN